MPMLRYRADVDLSPILSSMEGGRWMHPLFLSISVYETQVLEIELFYGSLPSDRLDPLFLRIRRLTICNEYRSLS